MIINPTIITKDKGKEMAWDVYSRLLQDRIIMLTHEINDDVATSICSQLLYLESVDPKKDIKIYISSPGGAIHSGMSIYDTMQYIKCDVQTICMGMAASMGAFLLAGGTKGKRFALPNAEIMIHQPLGGAEGQASEIEIAAKHILYTKDKMTKMLSEFTGQDYDTIKNACDRDNWLTAEEAKKFGLIDKIITKNK